MLKKETFNIEDSNVAGLGSDLDKQCRQDAAATEKAWANAGKAPGMQIWRIEKFKVKKSMTPAGTFYSDDSYICLNTYHPKDENGNPTDKLAWDIHFWLGKTTSQDEAGTAAYKTVELDDLLGGGPVQHREVQGYESSLFLSYFKKAGGIQLLEGGIESGFNKVRPETYKPRLLHLKGRKNIRVEEAPIHFASLNSGDVFILDNGLEIFQWQGKSAGKNEKARAGQLCRAIDDERRGKPEVYVFRQGDPDEKDFFKFFPGFEEGKAPTISDESADDNAWEKDSDKRLYQLSDSSGKLEFTLVAEKTVKKSMLNSNDVFVFDIGSEIFAWVGKGSSAQEKRGAMQSAQEYLKMHKRPPMLPITKLLEGGDNEAFNSSFDRE
jgi:gelsolin